MHHFQVQGLTCGHCVQAVTKAVKAVDPRADIAVDLTAKSVTVDSAADEEAVADAIRGAGYEVSV